MSTKDLMGKITECAAHGRSIAMEAYVRSFLEKTGLPIDQVELVEKHDREKIVWYLRKKGSDD